MLSLQRTIELSLREGNSTHAIDTATHRTHTRCDVCGDLSNFCLRTLRSVLSVAGRIYVLESVVKRSLSQGSMVKVKVRTWRLTLSSFWKTQPMELHDTQSVGRPWTSDRPDAETSTWQQTKFARDRPPCAPPPPPPGHNTPHPPPRPRAAPAPVIRPRAHRDRRLYNLAPNLVISHVTLRSHKRSRTAFCQEDGDHSEKRHSKV
jgi:hypothetical protein